MSRCYADRMRSCLGIAVSCVALAACGGQVSSGADGGSDGASNTDAGKVCSKDVKCSDSEYCDYPNDDCGRGGATGTCKARPMGCPLLYAPVCTCQSQIAANDCTAHSGGSDLNADGNCMQLGGYVPCGARFCDAQTSYCQISYGDVPLPDGGVSVSYGCQPLPTKCVGSKDCACFMGASGVCPGPCKVAGDGFQVVCPGG